MTGWCSLTSLHPQLSCYDQAKQLVLSTGYLSDGIFTHFIASFIAVSPRRGGRGRVGALTPRQPGCLAPLQPWVTHRVWVG